MPHAPSCFSLKIQGCISVGALIGDGIKKPRHIAVFLFARVQSNTQFYWTLTRLYFELGLFGLIYLGQPDNENAMLFVSLGLVYVYFLGKQNCA